MYLPRTVAVYPRLKDRFCPAQFLDVGGSYLKHAHVLRMPIKHENQRVEAA